MVVCTNNTHVCSCAHTQYIHISTHVYQPRHPWANVCEDLQLCMHNTCMVTPVFRPRTHSQLVKWKLISGLTQPVTWALLGFTICQSFCSKTKPLIPDFWEPDLSGHSCSSPDIHSCLLSRPCLATHTARGPQQSMEKTETSQRVGEATMLLLMMVVTKPTIPWALERLPRVMGWMLCKQALTHPVQQSCGVAIFTPIFRIRKLAQKS